MRSGVFADYKIFAGNSHPELAEEIAGIMGKPLGRATVTKFSDGEISVNIWETVRGLDVYIIQSTCNPVNDNLMELLIMIDAMKRASAGRLRFFRPKRGFVVSAIKNKIPTLYRARTILQGASSTCRGNLLPIRRNKGHRRRR